MTYREERNSHKTIKIVGSIITGALIIVGFVALFAYMDIRAVGEATDEKPYSDFLENTLLENFPDCPGKYDREYLPRKMFCQLPDKSKDFNEYMILYSYGRIEDLERIPKDVWIQPEFSTSWTGEILKILQHPPEDRIGGGGQLPQIDNADAGIILSRGDTGRLNFIVRNSPLSIFFLGMTLRETYPAYQTLEFEDINIQTTQNPDTARQCFNVNITPDEFALAPSFPVIVYDEEYQYSKMIRVLITVNDDCPPGEYVLGINPAPPSKEFSNDYYEKEFRGKKILTKYSSVGGFIGIDRPFFRAFINVK
jgi:hypothetical protein